MEGANLLVTNHALFFSDLTSGPNQGGENGKDTDHESSFSGRACRRSWFSSGPRPAAAPSSPS
jgi:hypothetical protein